MQNILHKADALATGLKALQPINPQHKEKLDKKFRLEFNYNSNHLEGNTLTYSETELLLIFDDTKGNHTMREYEEMKAHDVALQLIEDWAADKERPLSEQNIKNLNEVILVRPYWKEAITPDGQNTRRQIIVGDYKKQPNSVRLTNGEIFSYASPSDTPIEMQGLIEWYRNQENELHPIALAALLHYKFVRIHPFDDGNGRVSRLLMNYVLLRNDLPPVIIKSTDKINYLRALQRADAGDMQSFIDYVAEQVIWSLEISLKAARGESIEEPEDIEKVIFMWKRSLKPAENGVLRSNQLIIDLLDKTINPLMERFVGKMQGSFSDLFNSFTIIPSVNGFQEFGGIEFLRSFLEKMVPDIKTISVFIEMEGFKNDGTNTFGYSTDLTIEFQDYKYLIKNNGRVKLEILNNHTIESSDSADLIRDILKETQTNIMGKFLNPPLSWL